MPNISIGVIPDASGLRHVVGHGNATYGALLPQSVGLCGRVVAGSLLVPEQVDAEQVCGVCLQIMDRKDKR
jgi:hypothetical protein